MTRKSFPAQNPAPPVRRRRKEARPAELIAAGLAEFGARGFAAARMEDVARRAGAAKGTVFRYFPTKEALFEAALISRLGPVFDEANAALDAHDGPIGPMLRLLLERLYRQLAESELPVLMHIIIAEGPRFPEILAAYHRESVGRGRALLSKLVERGIARGEFRRNAVAALPMVRVSPMLMAAIWGMTFAAIEPIPPARFLEAHLALITEGLCADADSPGGR